MPLPACPPLPSHLQKMLQGQHVPWRRYTRIGAISVDDNHFTQRNYWRLTSSCAIGRPSQSRRRGNEYRFM